MPQWYAYRVELENWQLDYTRWQMETRRPGPRRRRRPRHRRSPGTLCDYREVLNPVFLRRRRKDIRELYGDDIKVAGRLVRFPEPRLSNLAYRLDKVYARAGSFAGSRAS